MDLEAAATGDGGKGSRRPPPLTAESLSALGEGISLVLSRWTALQVAVENQWGGRDSRRKSDELASTILSWFAQLNAEHYIDDLEEMLDDYMESSLNTMIDDGSIEEVAEKLMVMHEECQEGIFESIEKLRKQVPRINAVSQSRGVLHDDGDESSDEEMPDMMDDEPKPKEIAVDQPKPREMPDEEGWTVVAPKRNKGKRSG